MMLNLIKPNQLLCRIFNAAKRINGPLRELRFKRSINNSSAYDGDGKTTVRVLNNEETHLNLVNTYSDRGFRLANNLFIAGSILLFPTHVYSWSVKRGIDITPESLIVFDLIVPKTKIVIIGYGEEGEPYDPAIPLILKKKGISCEMLTTPNAVTTYNYLVHDAVHAAGAFVPVKNRVSLRPKDIIGMNEGIVYTDKNSMKRRDEDSAIPIITIEEIDKWKKVQSKDPDRKKFEE